MLSKLTKLAEEYNVGNLIRLHLFLTLPRIARSAYYKPSPMYYLESSLSSIRCYLTTLSRPRSNDDFRGWRCSKANRGAHSFAFFGDSYIPTEGYVH